jgi:hypothetical protein
MRVVKSILIRYISVALTFTSATVAKSEVNRPLYPASVLVLATLESPTEFLIEPSASVRKRDNRFDALILTYLNDIVLIAGEAVTEIIPSPAQQNNQEVGTKLDCLYGKVSPRRGQVYMRSKRKEYAD